MQNGLAGCFFKYDYSFSSREIFGNRINDATTNGCIIIAPFSWFSNFQLETFFQIWLLFSDNMNDCRATWNRFSSLIFFLPFSIHLSPSSFLDSCNRSVSLLSLTFCHSALSSSIFKPFYTTSVQFFSARSSSFKRSSSPFFMNASGTTFRQGFLPCHTSWTLFGSNVG